MGFKKFSLLIAVRTSLVLLNLLLLSYLLRAPGFDATTSLAFILLFTQCVLFYRFVAKTNAELVRFFDAARYADFTQRFEFKGVGAGFGDLGAAFSDILQRFQAVRAGQEEDLRHLHAMIEHVPVPLLSVHADGTLTLWNNSARRLFGTNRVSSVDDLHRFGTEFAEHLRSVRAGERRLVTFEVDGMIQQLTISATELIVAGKREKLLSMQDIQSELDGAQLQAWQDLVRVLTHEIMNSITPVASLAKTAVDLLEDAKSKISEHPSVVDELADVSDAVQTVARRSDGLTKFVGSYRRLTRLPPPQKKRLKVREVFSEVTAIASQQWPAQGIGFSCEIEPEHLELLADPAMLEQILLNLLQNAAHAVASLSEPQVRMAAAINKRGHMVLSIEDNGAGVSEDIASKIFVPFFTTKRDGSGVGLALTRQVMIAHGGTVKLERSELGGALFRLIF